MLGEIFAPVIDGVRQLPQIVATDGGMPSKMESAMRKWLVGKPCAVCGSTKQVQAHHLFPRHIWPQLAYDNRLWYPLCRGNKEIDCHAVIGHGSGNMKGFNPFCIAMAEMMRAVMASNQILLARIREEQKNNGPRRH